MQFKLNETGQIRVKIKLCDPLFTGSLEFEYLMDQTFIPELIREIEISLEV